MFNINYDGLEKSRETFERIAVFKNVKKLRKVRDVCAAFYEKTLGSGEQLSRFSEGILQEAETTSSNRDNENIWENCRYLIVI